MWKAAADGTFPHPSENRSAVSHSPPTPATAGALYRRGRSQQPSTDSGQLHPLLWSAVGTLAAVQLGVVEDYGLGAAGVATLALLVAQHRRTTSPLGSARRAETP